MHLLVCDCDLHSNFLQNYLCVVQTYSLIVVTHLKLLYLLIVIFIVCVLEVNSYNCHESPVSYYKSVF